MRQLKITQQITSRTEGSIESYLQEVAKLDMLTVEQEAEIANTIKNGKTERERTAARDLLVKSNLRFVISCAKKYAKPNVSLLDIIQEGNIGLMVAAENFDATKGFKFISYAVWWIRQSIMKYLSEHTSMVRLPLNKINALNKIYTFTTQYMLLNGIEPSTDLIADKVDMREDEVETLLNEANSSKCGSLDTTLSDDSDDCVGSFIPSGEVTDRAVDRESDCHSLMDVLKKLSEREQYVLCQSFGIGCQEKGLDEIGQDLNLTRERVRQIRINACAKLRNKFGKELGVLFK